MQFVDQRIPDLDSPEATELLVVASGPVSSVCPSRIAVAPGFSARASATRRKEAPYCEPITTLS